MVIRNCKQCGKEFKTKPCLIKIGRGKFCSKSCASSYRTSEKNPVWKGSKITKKCLICEKEFKTVPSRIKIGKGKFCSRKCYGNWQSENTKGINSPSWKGGDIILKCLICTKKFKARRFQIKVGTGKYCSISCAGKARSGERAPRWIDGRTPLNHKIRNSFEYKEWRKLICERDNWTCQVCSKRGGNMRANHIKKFSDYPELQLVLNNGITIHKECDLKFVLHYEENCEDFFNFNLIERGYL